MFALTADAVEESILPFGALLSNEKHILKFFIEDKANNHPFEIVAHSFVLKIPSMRRAKIAPVITQSFIVCNLILNFMFVKRRLFVYSPLEVNLSMAKKTFKIEAGIEIPTTGAKACAGRESEVDWPFKKMKKGQSILVPFEMANAAQVRIRHEGFDASHFTTRRVAGKGVRIWRIK